MKRQLTAMIVDDEPLARQGLLMRIEKTDCIKAICSCASASEATLAMTQYAPDVVFLDIEMPGMSGIDFAAWLKDNGKADVKIVFVTAFKQFALDAFEFEAFDYLLKPFSDERFEACISKLILAQSHDDLVSEHDQLNSLLQAKTGDSINGLMRQLKGAEPGKVKQQKQTISLKSGTQWIRVDFDSINWIEAAGDYMCVHTEEGTHIIRKTLKDLQEELDPQLFVRVNRSAIINTSKLVTLTPNSNGEYIAALSSGDSVKVSRKYKAMISELNTH